MITLQSCCSKYVFLNFRYDSTELKSAIPRCLTSSDRVSADSRVTSLGGTSADLSEKRATSFLKCLQVTKLDSFPIKNENKLDNF